MPTFIEQQVQGLMNDLASCLCSTLANAAEAGEVPAVCFCGVIPGTDAVLDFCGDGQAWVRLAGIVPVIDEQFNDCVMQYDVTLEVGVARCAPMVGELGDPPTLAEQFDANVTLVRDMGLMHKVITCCDTVADQGRPEQFTTFGPEGDCLGGAWMATWRIV